MPMVGMRVMISMILQKTNERPQNDMMRDLQLGCNASFKGKARKRGESCCCFEVGFGLALGWLDGHQ